MRALLDVNILIALLDQAHVHHARAGHWLADNIRHGWASCPLTQLGCIRIMSNSSYLNSQPAIRIAERLAQAADTSYHQFWPADIAATSGDHIHWSQILTSRHATDVYLLALAVAHGGRFVTFDEHVPTSAAAGAKARHLLVIP